MKKWLKILFNDLAALLLGIMLTFAFAPYDIFPLAIVAPAGLLALWLNTTPKRAAWLGFLFGLGLFGAGVYWVFHSIHVIGEVPTLLAGVITAGMIAYLALYPAIVGYLTNRYFPVVNTAKLVCAFPAIWVASEWLRSWFLTGFPWLLIGYSQTNSPLKGYAPILSVYGVSLAVLMSSALIVNAVVEWRQKAYRYAYFNLLAWVLIWVAGGLFSLIPWTRPEGNSIPVSLVQGNIAQTIKWSPEHLQQSFERYTELTQPLWAKDKLIIWPETAIPLPLQNAAGFIQTMDEKAKASGSHLILGIPIRAENIGFYNAIVTLGSDKKVYIKRRLVPFGEYTPFSNLLSNVLKFMNLPMSDMVPGKINQGPLIIGNLKILPSICYEIAYPELLKTQDSTINLMLTVTNDAWFGDSSAQAQHLQMAEMRSIEFGRPALFVSNDGITAIIGPDGKIEAAAPQREVFVLNGTVQPTIGLTPWMKNGIDPILFILIFLLGTAVHSNMKAAYPLKVSRNKKIAMQDDQ